MPDKKFVIDSLRNIESTLEYILERTEWVKTVDDFVSSTTGTDMLDIVAIRLMAVGEEVKRLDRKTGGELLSRYTQVEWRGVIGLRDIIAHGYFHIDAAVVFDTLQNDIRPMLDVIRKILQDER